MGRPPAYIFIVRHGSRLDAADKLWHITSPTPYDPPLTYGGWTQARAIGQRIADILRENAAPIETPPARTASPDAPESPAPAAKTGPAKRRRYRVVIHSSPFLRCLQTSIAVGAGISSDGQPLESPHPPDRIPAALQPRTPNQKALPDAPAKEHKDTKEPDNIHKSVLRVDGFLGEWLSPDYFELISPPPGSAAMVTGAKTELLRREDYSSFLHAPHHQTHSHSHSTGHLWNASRSNTWSSQQLAGQDELPKSGSQPISPPGLFGGSSSSATTAAAASSDSKDGDRLFGTGGDQDAARRRTVSGAGAPGSARAGYTAPFPNFALSHQAPAPAGYVAHARDHCILVDYQWDSMRAPYDWGDGGEFGEEWTAMHRRFRKGLQKLVDWYATSDAPYEMVTQTVHFKSHPSAGTARSETSECAIDDDDDEDALGATDAAGAADDEYVDETVVILVSHGAGCNALIGAITQEPVLMDVGLASLSVAVRKPGMTSVPTAAEAEHERERDRGRGRGQGSNAGADRAPGGRHPHSRHPSGIIPLHRYYEMKLFANSDHLRSTPTSPTVSSPGAGAGFGSGGSGRGASMAMVMGSGATRSRHANSLSGTLGNLAYLDNGGALPGAVGGDAPVRRSVSTVSRSYMHTPGGGSIGRSGSSSRGGSGLPNNNSDSPTHTRSRTSKAATGGITIGSGVTSFLTSPAAAAATSSAAATPGSAQSAPRSDSGGDVRPRTGSFGLWSPVIRPRDALSDYGGSGHNKHGLGLGLGLGQRRSSINSSNSFAVGGDDDVIEDDDIEILLSFTPDTAAPGPAPTSAPAEKPPAAAAGGARADTPMKKADKENTATPPSARARAAPMPGMLPRRLVGLHISTGNSDDDDDDDIDSGPPRSSGTNGAVAGTAPGKTAGAAAATSPTPSAGSSNNGLWSSPFSDPSTSVPRL